MMSLNNVQVSPDLIILPNRRKGVIGVVSHEIKVNGAINDDQEVIMNKMSRLLYAVLGNQF